MGQWHHRHPHENARAAFSDFSNLRPGFKKVHLQALRLQDPHGRSVTDMPGRNLLRLSQIQSGYTSQLHPLIQVWSLLVGNSCIARLKALNQCLQTNGLGQGEFVLSWNVDWLVRDLPSGSDLSSPSSFTTVSTLLLILMLG